MQSVPMKMVCAYFRALQSTKVLLCPFHCEVEKRIGSCTLEFISVPPVLASCCRIKKHHKVGIPVPVGSSIGSRPTIPIDHPRLCVPFGEPSLLSLCLSVIAMLRRVCLQARRSTKRNELAGTKITTISIHISFNFPL